MRQPLDYRSPAGPDLNFAPNVYGRAACAIACFLAGWYVWGAFKLLDAFYSGPGNAPYGPAHRPWWYATYGVGVLAAAVGLALGMFGLRARGASKASAIVGIALNAIGLSVYLAALPYPN